MPTDAPVPATPLFTLLTAVPTLTSARLELSAHRRADFADSLALWRDPAVTRFIGGRPASEAEIWQRLMRYLGQWTLLGYGYWALRERASGRFLGEVGFLNFRPGLGARFQDRPEAGWVLSPSAQGQGYAAEATRLAHDWLAQHLAEKGEPMRTVCLIQPDNAPSIRLAEKLGYRRYAETEYADRPVLLFERAAKNNLNRNAEGEALRIR